MNTLNANLNKVTSRGGIFYDLNAVSATLGNDHILGRSSAANIYGDISKTYVLARNSSVYIPPQVVAMNLRRSRLKHSITTNMVKCTGVMRAYFSMEYFNPREYRSGCAILWQYTVLLEVPKILQQKMLLGD